MKIIGERKFKYLPYDGPLGFAYLTCTSGDAAVAIKLADKLVMRGFRLSCNIAGSKSAQNPHNAADSISRCSGAVAILSEKSIESLAFRNEINYIFSLHKPLVCIKIGDFKLSHGLDMQLSNITMIDLSTTEDITDSLLESGVLTHEMLGGGMERLEDNTKQKKIILAMIIAALLIFSVSIGIVIKKHTSAAYILRDADGMEYVNISEFGDEGLLAMAGKTVGELDLSGGDFSSIANVKNLSAKTINVSDISTSIALWPLIETEGLETVKISQDQYIYARELYEAGIRVVITH